jgi:hypothetical protein
MWHFTATYPYPWMREHREAVPAPPDAIGKMVENVVDTDHGSTLPLAA